MREYRVVPRGYELMVLINPELADEALATEVDQISDLIRGVGGDVVTVKRDTPWGRRRLAYPIQRFRDATYVLYRFNAAPSRVLEIERDLKLDERVIRYLVVRQDEQIQPPEAPEGQEAQAAETAAPAEPAATAGVSAEVPAGAEQP